MATWTKAKLEEARISKIPVLKSANLFVATNFYPDMAKYLRRATLRTWW